MKRKNNVRVAHKCAGRIRLVCEQLTDESDVSAIEAKISEFAGVKSARVNKHAKSIVVEYDKNFGEILEFIQNLDMPKKAKDASKPSKANIYKAGAALALTPLISNRTVKTAIGLYASAPNLLEGASELRHEGVTSKVLEAMAVGVSLARGDQIARI